MDVPGGLMCRYCAKKWFPHSLGSHEKNCHRKIAGLIDRIYDQHRKRYALPPDYVQWPTPPKVDADSYNAHAFAEYTASQQPCLRCLR